MNDRLRFGNQLVAFQVAKSHAADHFLGRLTCAPSNSLPSLIRGNKHLHFLRHAISKCHIVSSASLLGLMSGSLIGTMRTLSLAASPSTFEMFAQTYHARQIQKHCAGRWQLLCSFLRLPSAEAGCTLMSSMQMLSNLDIDPA